MFKFLILLLAMFVIIATTLRGTSDCIFFCLPPLPLPLEACVAFCLPLLFDVCCEEVLLLLEFDVVSPVSWSVAADVT